jgi:hypothetical protein
VSRKLRESIFANTEFCNGFIDFCESEKYEKYMVPFLSEMIDELRDKLEGTDDVARDQGRIESVRKIAEKASFLKVLKKDKAKNFPS